MMLTILVNQCQWGKYCLYLLDPLKYNIPPTSPLFFGYTCYPFNSPHILLGMYYRSTFPSSFCLHHNHHQSFSVRKVMVYKAFAETFLLKTTQRKSALNSEKMCNLGMKNYMRSVCFNVAITNIFFGFFWNRVVLNKELAFTYLVFPLNCYCTISPFLERCASNE